MSMPKDKLLLAVLDRLDPASLYSSPLFSDVILVGKDGSQSAHRLILAACCPLLKAALESAGEMSDTDPGIVRFPDYTQEDIGQFLRVLYGRHEGQVSEIQREMLLMCGFRYFMDQEIVPVISNVFHVSDSEDEKEDCDSDNPDDPDDPEPVPSPEVAKVKEVEEPEKPKMIAFKKPEPPRPEPQQPTKIVLKRDKDGNFLCPVQNCAFSNKEMKAVGAHLAKVHPKLRVTQKKETVLKNTNVLIEVCNQCGKIVLKDKMATHIRSHIQAASEKRETQRLIEERNIQVTASARAATMGGAPKKPKRVYLFECVECGEKDRRKCAILDHLFAQHALNRRDMVLCKICCAVVGPRQSITMHESVCDAPAKTRATTTRKNLGRRKGITSWVKVPWDENNPPKECPYEGCDYANPVGSRVKSHYINSHIRQQCPYCDVQVGIGYYESHITLKHKKNFDHICNVCQKGFHNDYNLTKHMDEVHIKKIKFRCQTCDMGFFSQFRLQRHNMRVHKNRGRFRCEPCKKMYDCKESLVKHLQRYHDGEGVDQLVERRKRKPDVVLGPNTQDMIDPIRVLAPSEEDLIKPKVQETITLN